VLLALLGYTHDPFRLITTTDQGDSRVNNFEADDMENPTSIQPTTTSPKETMEDFDDEEVDAKEDKFDMFGGGDLDKNLDKIMVGDEGEDDVDLDEIDNILELSETQYPKFTLAKNKARFLRMVSWYRAKEEWIEVAPVSGVTKLFKQQTKELEGIRSSKLDYEMELETGTLTPSQRSYRKDELKMCRVQEKMAVHLISKLQLKIKSGRR
jgi:hypothetical protein